MSQKWCMSFSNCEIKHFIVDKLCSDVNYKCLLDDKYVNLTSNKDIEFLTFDGEKQCFYLSFLKFQTSLFIHDCEIMFIDDNEKKNYNLSDVYHNIVYEGSLNALTHEQILSIFLDLVKVFYGSEKMEVSQTVKDSDGSYPKYNYCIRLLNRQHEKSVHVFENIRIEIYN